MPTHIWNQKVYHSYKKRSGLQKYSCMFVMDEKSISLDFI